MVTATRPLPQAPSHPIPSHPISSGHPISSHHPIPSQVAATLAVLLAPLATYACGKKAGAMLSGLDSNLHTLPSHIPSSPSSHRPSSHRPSSHRPSSPLSGSHVLACTPHLFTPLSTRLSAEHLFTPLIFTPLLCRRDALGPPLGHLWLLARRHQAELPNVPPAQWLGSASRRDAPSDDPRDCLRHDQTDHYAEYDGRPGRGRRVA
jgi:hypothetical protein